MSRTDPVGAGHTVVVAGWVQVESRKRYEFLEALVSSMDAHVRFFERGSQMLAGLGPYIQHSLEVGR